MTDADPPLGCRMLHVRMYLRHRPNSRLMPHGQAAAAARQWGTAVKKRGREKKEGLNEVDVFVGQRLRELRMLAGLSQSDVASALGLTFQQLQKYERGFNRVSASRLYKLAQFFRVPVSVFFEGLEQQRAAHAETGEGTGGEESETTLRSREALMLARYFQNIRDPQIRGAIRELAERMADAGEALGGHQPDMGELMRTAGRRGRAAREQQSGRA
jgi:transcriptional regulator with XRE-family HTH domain